ncbi:MAG: Na(+)-translocating NADH-quinone reductase subunit C [Gemmatimonadetes bacterium]|nr:Na(+)-translocating NADH-quinone reductase subunit C [Gemmatimonadota bacterium]
MRKDSPMRVILVAVALCLVCSVLVSAAAVVLRPEQELNKALDKKKNILLAAGLIEPKGEADIDAVYTERVEARLVDLETGEYTDAFPVDAFDQRDAAKDPAQSIEIPDKEDPAGIGRRSLYAPVYLVRESPGSNEFSGVIIPVHGKGLWSTLYGFLALDSDLNTIEGLGFYEHAETPGLGGEVDNPNWKAQWKGKQVYEDGKVEISVIKGKVNPNSPDKAYEIDGIAGATITARGVSNLVQYWMGSGAFQTYITRVREQGLS